MKIKMLTRYNKNIILKHFEVRGNNYECGAQIGKALREPIYRRLSRAVPDGLLEKNKKTAEKIYSACQEKYPRFIEELRGIAEGAKADFWEIFLLNCEELREADGGCTSIAEVLPDGVSLAHNEDTDSAFGDKREDCALVTYCLKDSSFTSFVYAGELPGDAYGWNSRGLFYSVNYLKPFNSKPLPGRVPSSFTARALMEAKNLEDAVIILKTSPDASGYHYYIGLRNRIISVEQRLNDISAREVTGIDAHANHYKHPKFAKGAPASQSSASRQKRADELLETGAKALDILTDRTNAPYAVCCLPGDDGLTLSTVRFSPQENMITTFVPCTLVEEYKFNILTNWSL